MPNASLRAYLVRRDAAGQVTGGLESLSAEALPPGDLVVRVHWSSLNYKDALAATGHPGVAGKLPHVPGIDAAGVVVECPGGQFAPGQSVVVTGYELGAPRWGGWAEMIRVPAEWAVPLPPTLTEREAMIYGTAGFTAAQSVMALQKHGITPEAGEVVVTGASGGVGSVAVGILAKLGYKVVAASGKAAEILKQLGATRIVGRGEVDDRSGKPLLGAKWAAAVDGVGGNTLATLLRTTAHRGCVAAYGLVGGADLAVSLYPFLLRGVALYGIDSAQCPMPERREVWHRLAGPWKLRELAALAEEIGPEQLGSTVQRMLKGETVGRVIVRWT